MKISVVLCFLIFSTIVFGQQGNIRVSVQDRKESLFVEISTGQASCLAPLRYLPVFSKAERVGTLIPSQCPEELNLSLHLNLESINRLRDTHSESFGACDAGPFPLKFNHSPCVPIDPLPVKCGPSYLGQSPVWKLTVAPQTHIFITTNKNAAGKVSINGIGLWMEGRTDLVPSAEFNHNGLNSCVGTSDGGVYFILLK